MVDLKSTLIHLHNYMKKKNTKNDLADLSTAVIAAQGKTPQVVLDAFIPVGVEVFGQMLRPVTTGTWMSLERIAHPFTVEGKAVTSYDIACAFYIFTTPTEDVFESIRNNTFESKVLKLVDRMPIADMQKSNELLQQHFTDALNAAVPMESPHDDGSQKKTVDSAGY